MPDRAPSIADPATFPTVETGWTDAILVCRRCSKKLKGGFGPDGRQKLAKTLRTVIRATGQRGHLAVLDVGCLSVCPKRAVTILRASQPDRLRVVPKGCDADTLARIVQDSSPGPTIEA